MDPSSESGEETSYSVSSRESTAMAKKTRRNALKKKAAAARRSLKATAQHEAIGDKEPSEFVGRKKRRTYKLASEISRAAKRAEERNLRTTMPRFGTYQFPNFKAFMSEWVSYFTSHYAMYRTKHSLSRDAKNTILLAAHAKKVQKAELKGSICVAPLLIPDHLTHFEITTKCVHGCTQSARGTGKRFPAATRYTGCRATIHAKAVYCKDSSKWSVAVDNGIREHNHALSPDVEVSAMVAAAGNPRLICDYISRRLVRAFTSQQLNNFRNYRLGGGLALTRLKQLLRQYVAHDGSRVLLIEDERGLVIGIAFQTKLQRAMFKLWGDSMLLDWTHNTNNVGYHLGSLMVTTANGKGVSVLDFLSVSQSKSMMRSILEHFIEWNSDAMANLRSVVIDKDYREWGVLKEVFGQRVDVVLCQFHVIKWFKHVISSGKYRLQNKRTRDKAMTILRGMVYAKNDEEFTHFQTELHDEVRSSVHVAFHKYMEDRWYSISAMWSYAGRGRIFTAANTTTNRLESDWKQLKDTLGKMQRIDSCVEAVFVHATSVMRREKKLLADYSTKTSLHLNLDLFLAPLFSELSSYASKLVSAQYDKFKFSVSSAGGRRYVAGPVTADRRVPIRVMGGRAPEEVVDLSEWTCSCSFFQGCSLPCRHVLFAAATVEKLNEFPVEGLAL